MTMSNLVAIAYDDESTAEKVLETLRRMQARHLIDLEDAVWVTHSPDGKVKLHQNVNTTAAGAAGGALWGTLIGLLFFMPLVGLAVGAGTGAIAGKLTDVGVDDKLAKTLGEKLRPGTSALLVLVRSVTADKVLPELRQFGGHLIQSSLPSGAEARLRAALAED
jgi:uncharacterized membrane protein